ncbi:TPA: hypothetical protein DD448_00465 [Candidatus Collierbacteria bacterium]|nr:hypothetical protein [Candidatus Collierbacteria bacterium]
MRQHFFATIDKAIGHAEFRIGFKEENISFVRFKVDLGLVVAIDRSGGRKIKIVGKNVGVYEGLVALPFG